MIRYSQTFSNFDAKIYAMQFIDSSNQIGNLLAIASNSGLMNVWDVQKGECIATYKYDMKFLNINIYKEETNIYIYYIIIYNENILTLICRLKLVGNNKKIFILFSYTYRVFQKWNPA